MAGVNIGVTAPVAFLPFSVWQDSFLGDRHALAIERFSRKKTITSRGYSDGRGHGAYRVEK
jgi:malonate-semialdehyde dehydrogenase (acetylating)/methylmalonate-semialdehyde dehydrogenase